MTHKGLMVRGALFCWVMLACAPAVAQTRLTGNQFHEQCTATDKGAQISALAYVNGVVDRELARPKPMLCPPAGVTGVQLRDIACLWVAETPQARHLPASDLIITAVFSLWPCPVKP